MNLVGNNSQMEMDQNNQFQPCLEDNANWFSRLFFLYTQKLMSKGSQMAKKKQYLQLYDLYDCSQQNHPQVQFDLVKKILDEDQSNQQMDQQKHNPKYRQDEIFRYILKSLLSNKSIFAKSIIIICIGNSLQLGSPFLMKKIIEILDDDESDAQMGYVYAAAIFLFLFTRVVLMQIGQGITKSILMQVQNGFSSSTLLKILNMSTSSRNYFTNGKIMNMINVDQQMLFMMSSLAYQLFSGPIIIVGSIIFICMEIGYWGLLTPFFFIFTIIAQKKINKIILTVRQKVMKEKDSRTRAIIEFIQGIKILKYQGWEDVAEKKINTIRESEFKFLLKNTYIRFSVEVMSTISPVLVAIIVLSCYAGSGNELTASKAYSIQAYFNLILFPLKLFMISLISLIQTKATIIRVNQFMSQENKKQYIIEDKELELGEFQVKNGYFSYETQESFFINNNFKIKILKQQASTKQEFNSRLSDLKQQQISFANGFENNICSINFVAKPGNIYGVIGECSSGKSTFLLSLLGEMHSQKETEIKKNGKVAYVPQTAWLQSATIKENIVFGLQYDEQKFQNVVKICQLTEDLNNIHGGANAQIGDGSTLSGGQKQRISIARAVYSDADIYLIDDCLSALDAHVGNNIFSQVIQQHLKDKTVIFVTHSLKIMPLMNQILVFKNGEIAEQGTYEELKNDLSSEFTLLAQDMLQKEREEEELANYNPKEIEEFDNYIFDDENGIPKEKLENEHNKLDKYFTSEQEIFTDMVQSNMLDQEYINSDFALSYKSNDSIIEIQNNFSKISDDLSHSSPAKNSFDDLSFQDKTQYQFVLKNRLQQTEQTEQSAQAGKAEEVEQVEQVEKTEQQTKESENEKEKTDQQKPAKAGLYKVEERAVGSTSYKVYWNYFQSGGIHMFFIVFNCLIFAQTMKIAQDWWVGQWAEDTYDLSTFQYILIYGISGLAVGLLFFLRGILFAKYSLKCASYYQTNITRVLFHTPMWWFDVTPSSRIIQRCTKDQDDLDTYLPFSILNSSIDMINVLGALILIMIILPLFILPILIISVIFIKLIQYYLTSIREIKRIEAIAKSPVNQCLQECVNGLYIIRAFQREEDFINKYIAKQRAYIVSITNLNHSQRWVGFVTELTGVLIIAGTCFFSIISKDFGSLKDASVMGLAISYSLQITSLLNSSLKRISEVESQMNASVRMLQYIQNNPQEKERNNPLPKITPWPTRGKIQVQNLTYRYRPNLPEVIKKIDFQISSKKKVGIVGRTGSGKSTMALGFLRIMEVSEDDQGSLGKILIDGQDISQVGLHILREKCTIIPQEAILFTGDLRFNIDPKNKYTDREIINALQQVGMWDQLYDLYETSCTKYNLKRKNNVTVQTEMDMLTLQHLKTEQEIQAVSQHDKQILEYRVVDGGSNFSLGQKQLICIARAIVKKPKVLIMDEATANIDEKTDQLIQNIVKNVLRNTTVITIAHRLNTIIQYDKIIVLEKGKVKEIGSPIDLINKETSLFSQLINEGGEEFKQKMIKMAQEK